MRNLLLASTSTTYGGEYLDYLTVPIQDLFAGIDEILFIPYARPGGISHDAYTQKVRIFFNKISIQIRGIHEFPDPQEAVANAKGIFAGGGNTFLLVRQLHELGLMDRIKNAVLHGTPYLGCSAGSNIAGMNMQTTNDMPIVYPPSFETMGLVPFNINPHFLSATQIPPRMGETREIRIQEFLTQNNILVIGLREGSWIRVRNAKRTLEGNTSAVIFERGKALRELQPGSEIGQPLQ